MKIELGKIYLVDVRDKKSGTRTTFFGLAEYKIGPRIFIGGNFCAFMCGWIWEDEIEWLSNPFPKEGQFETERMWLAKNTEHHST